MIKNVSSTWARTQRGPVALGVLLLLFALAVLLPGFKLAGRLDDTAAALRLVSEQRRQPDIVFAALAAVRDRLESFGYVEEPLAELRTGVKELDGLISKLAASPAGFGAFDASPARAVQGSASLQAQLA